MNLDKGSGIFNLERFVRAQAGIYQQVCAELRAGSKSTHWMWFIFPQIAGLGMSEMSVRFAIASLDEARAYLEHALLGVRLRECTGIVNGLTHKTAEEVFGYPDDIKFRSSMTLFAHAAEKDSLFQRALDKYFSGEMDAGTLKRI